VAPARVGSVLGDDVDDGEAPGTVGSSWGGSNRRRASAAITGSEAAIGWRQWAMSRVEWLWWSSEERGRRWCAWIDAGRSPFIGTRGCCGAVKKSTMARRLRRAVELGEVVAVFYGSWRCYWRRQRGRAVARLVALLPRRPRRVREQVIVSGAGGHGSGLGACLVASRCHCGAQRVASGARACSRSWRGACPVYARGVHTRDASGVQGAMDACLSGLCGVPPRQRPMLGDPVE
jgi:hypothetical protein